MSENFSKMPNSVEDLMVIYTKYEDSFQNKDKKPRDMLQNKKPRDILQNAAFFDNPITPTHNDYYSSKYKKGHNWMKIIFIFSIVLYTLHFIGFYLILNSLGVNVLKNAISRTILIIIYNLTFVGISFFVAKNVNKWNWKSRAILFALFIGIMFSVLFLIDPPEIEIEDPTKLEIEFFLTFLYSLFNILAVAYAPAFLCVFIIYKFYSSIPDYGGIHLFFGWIYRISETYGDLEVLNSSFHHLIYEIDNWLNETSKILINNKNEILEGFYFNLISNKKFLENISKKYRDSFNNIFTGLLGEDILNSKAFSDIEDKRISHLKSKWDLRYLKYRLALTQFPKIIYLIETLSSIKVKITYYSYSEKLRKIRLKIIPVIVFMTTTIIPFLLSLFA